MLDDAAPAWVRSSVLGIGVGVRVALSVGIRVWLGLGLTYACLGLRRRGT
jgi:hypothetical protein